MISRSYHVYPRVIPALLLDGERLVKTEGFADPVYVGDPVNVLSIFNDFEVDEIALLDISRARGRERFDARFLARVVSECFVPLAFGGGISESADAEEIISIGVEKVIINSMIIENPLDVRRLVDSVGSQAVVGALDVRRRGDAFEVYTRGGTRRTGLPLQEWCRMATDLGVGEVLLTSIDREGSRSGFDLDAVRIATQVLGVPVIAHGGAGSRQDLPKPVLEAGASAVAAGSLFVFQSGRESVLVNYPSRVEIESFFGPDASSSDQGIAPQAFSGQLPSAAPLIDSVETCRRCLITVDVPGASFDSSGVCFYCRLHDSLEAQYPTGAQGRQQLEQLADKLRKAGTNSPYDCILGVSGGCDSSYLVHLMVELGVRPLAVHFDNTWNSPTATANIYSVLGACGVDLETYVVDNTEYDDIYRAFMLAGVKDVEAPTDIGFMGVLYRAAEKHGIKNIIEGHSFRTEGVSPLGWLYMDGGYISSVHERFGRVPMKTYPNMEFGQFVRWAALSGIERHRPLYHLDYHKEDTKSFLTRTYGWQWYGGHHLENRFTAFYHSYLLPVRFGIDFRLIEYSALVRSGQMMRDEGFERLHETRVVDPELLAMVQKRLGFTDAEFERVMTQPHHTYREFSTYKQRFERLRPLFWALYKMGRVPKSFYVKFCT